MHRTWLILGMLACGPAQDGGAKAGSAADACKHDGASSDCLQPMQAPEHYVEQSHRYFDTMDSSVEHTWPEYSELVARWEWPPWLKLTAFGLDNIHATDALLVAFPSIVVERDCRAFDEQPFGRCTVVFYYDDHDGRPCPIYEEFTFNDQGEVTFIEAWSDLPGLLPMPEDDPWAEGSDVARLSTRIPGLGNAQGLLDLQSSWMLEAAAADEDVADFVHRANNWQQTWLEELAASDGDTMWEVGCGW
jgi:hypothetical protein